MLLIVGVVRQCSVRNGRRRHGLIAVLAIAALSHGRWLSMFRSLLVEEQVGLTAGDDFIIDGGDDGVVVVVPPLVKTV